MNRINAKIFTIAGFFFLLVLAVQGHAAQEWKIDKDHSALRFSVRHFVTPVVGGFDLFSGNLSFDPKEPEKSVMDIKVEVKSVNTGVQQRDDHLRSADFFEVEKFQELRFVSESFNAKGNNKFDVQGKMTIKDITRDLVLELEYMGERDFPFPHMKCMIVGGLVGHTTLNRMDYGVGTGQFLEVGAIGNEVEIDVFLELHRPKADCQ